MESNNMLAEIFSFVSGPKVIHKIALLSKRVREILIKSKNQARNRTVTLKVQQPKIIEND